MSYDRIKWPALTFISFTSMYLGFSYILDRPEQTHILVLSITLNVLVGSVLLHLYGHKSHLVFIPFFGALAKHVKSDFEPQLSDSQICAVNLSGPFINFCLIIVGAIVYILRPDSVYSQTLISLNAALLVFNLLPIAPFRGGQVIKALRENLTGFGDIFALAFLMILCISSVIYLMFLGKLDIYFLPIFWGSVSTGQVTWLVQTKVKDSTEVPEMQGMTSSQSGTVLMLYTVMLFVAILASVFLPHWLKIMQ